MTSTTPKQEDDSWRVRMYNDEHGPESDLEKRKLENYLIKKKNRKNSSRRNKTIRLSTHKRSKSTRKYGKKLKTHTRRKNSKTPIRELMRLFTNQPRKSRKRLLQNKLPTIRESD